MDSPAPLRRSPATRWRIGGQPAILPFLFLHLGVVFGNDTVNPPARHRYVIVVDMLEPGRRATVMAICNSGARHEIARCGTCAASRREPGRGADVPLVGGRPAGRDGGARAVASLGPRVPARWAHAGHRAAGASAHR